MLIEALKSMDTKDMDPEVKAAHDSFLKSQMFMEALRNSKKGYSADEMVPEEGD